MKPSRLFAFVSSALSISVDSAAFVHPGLLHTAADLTRVARQVNAGAEPWLTGWNQARQQHLRPVDLRPRPVQLLCRGTPASCTQNYSNIYRDAAYGTAAANSGNSDKYLASGLYGYQLASAAEILRDFEGFTAANMTALVDLLVNVFYPMNHRFLVEHNDTAVDHYWANWDLCNLATMMSTGIGQLQENGRDQGHPMLDVALLGVIAQMTYSQGLNPFTYQNSRIPAAAAEYAAKYNLGNDVQYTTYVDSDVTQTVISNNSRGNVRPIRDLLYNHYVKIEGLEATYTTQQLTAEEATTAR